MLTTPEDIRAYFVAIEGHSFSAWCTIVALALCAVFLKIYFGKGVTERKKNWLLVGAITCAAVIVASQGLNVWWHSNTFHVTSAKEAFAALESNERVRYAIRLIPYSSRDNKAPSITNLYTIGRPGDRYVFVADYDELKNMTVAEAVYKIGGSLTNTDCVTGIIFPIKHRQLYPANALGVLQVIALVNAEQRGATGYTEFPLEHYLGPRALDLVNTPNPPLATWEFKNYSQYFNDYANTVKSAEDNHADALAYIGGLDRDWSPLGYSQVIDQSVPQNETDDFELTANDGAKIKAPNFGARAFLIENYQIKDIDNVMLLNFTSPDTERVPDIDDATSN